jgi:hypothetical protein
MTIEVQAGKNFVVVLVDNRLYLKGTWMNQDGSRISYNNYTEIPISLNEAEKIKEIIAENTYIILLTTSGRLFFAGKHNIKGNKNIFTHISDSLFSYKFDLVVPPEADCTFVKIGDGMEGLILLSTAGMLYQISHVMVSVQACLFENTARIVCEPLIDLKLIIQPENVKSIRWTQNILLILENNGKLNFAFLPQDKAGIVNQLNFICIENFNQIYYGTKKFMLYRNNTGDFYSIAINYDLMKRVSSVPKINFSQLPPMSNNVSVIIPNNTLKDLAVLFTQENHHVFIYLYKRDIDDRNIVIKDKQPIASLTGYQLVTVFEDQSLQQAVTFVFSNLSHKLRLELILKQENSLFTSYITIDDQTGFFETGEIKELNMPKNLAVQNDKNAKKIINYHMGFLGLVIAICKGIDIEKMSAIDTMSEQVINLRYSIMYQLIQRYFHQDFQTANVSSTNDIYLHILNKEIPEKEIFKQTWNKFIEPFFHLIRQDYQEYIHPAIQIKDLIFFLQIVCYINLHHIINNSQNIINSIDYKEFLDFYRDDLISDIPSNIKSKLESYNQPGNFYVLSMFVKKFGAEAIYKSPNIAAIVFGETDVRIALPNDPEETESESPHLRFFSS